MRGKKGIGIGLLAVPLLLASCHGHPSTQCYLALDGTASIVDSSGREAAVLRFDSLSESTLTYSIAFAGSYSGALSFEPYLGSSMAMIPYGLRASLSGLGPDGSGATVHSDSAMAADIEGITLNGAALDGSGLLSGRSASIYATTTVCLVFPDGYFHCDYPASGNLLAYHSSLPDFGKGLSYKFGDGSTSANAWSFCSYVY